MTMKKYFNPKHPVRCVITGPSECGISVILTKLILNLFNEYNRIYIYSRSLHQYFYRKLFKCFDIHILIHIIPNNLNDENIDVVIEEIFKKRL